MRYHSIAGTRPLPRGAHRRTGLCGAAQDAAREISPAAGEAVEAWIRKARLQSADYLFPSRIHESGHIGTRQYARILRGWVQDAGLDPAAYGTHSMRRTKPTLIYRRTKNLRAVQLLLSHQRIESTIRYLGIEVDDALEIAEQTEV